MSDHGASPASAPPVPPGPAPPVQTIVRQDKTISRQLTDLHVALKDAAFHNHKIVEHFQAVKARWWVVALAIHRAGQHHAALTHVLDWPGFLRQACSASNIVQMLHAVYRDQWYAAKQKQLGRLVNTQKALGLSETIEVMLELGPAACVNISAIAGISSLRKPTNHAPVAPNDIRQALLNQLLVRANDDEVDDGPPELSPADVRKAVSG